MAETMNARGSHWSGKNATRYSEKIPASGLNAATVGKTPGRS